MFEKRIDFTVGEKIYKPLEIKMEDTNTEINIKTRGFWYCDLPIV
jgi:hypothetical protein